ncbi:MAG TPA: hypothetical protein VHI95_19355 [Acidimicrobiales bacterium]|jgi:hypothetical protein|nr:hypothetical protein [Acidimicrobiales bacterium]
MSMTNNQTTTTSRPTSGVRAERHIERRAWSETRLFAKTSEFWAMLVGVAAIVVIYNAADDASFDLWRACLLGVVLATAYIVSRGIAKSGTSTPDDRDDRDTAHDDRYS